MEQIFSEFELMFPQLNLHSYSSLDKCSVHKARLLKLCSEYYSLTAEQDFLAWESVHFRTNKSLKSRNSIYITKSGKGSGIVVLNN